MSPESISATAATIAAVVAAFAVILQWRQARFTARLNTLLSLWSYFDSEAVREARRAAADGLLAGNAEDADHVLDFFEGVGLLVRRGAIDSEMAWSSFSAWVFGYCEAAQEHIRSSRAQDDTTWCDLELLHQEFIDLQIARSRQRRRLIPHYSTDELTAFLEAEAALGSRGERATET